MPSIAKDSEQSVIRITERLERVQTRVRTAAQAAGRDPRTVTVLAVSKQQPIALLRAAAQAGQRAFGENYLQEAVDKITALAELELQWHFIGKIQSNKTRPIARHFDWVHTLDRPQIARRLNAQRAESQLSLNVCIQVALSNEPAKAGVVPAELPALAQLVAQQPRLRLRGLMCIPPPSRDPDDARPYFGRLRELFEQLNKQGLALDTLSMGMSADLEAAVSEGATLVRIGSAIFGPRGAAGEPGTQG